MAFSLDRLVSNVSLEKQEETEKVFKDKIEFVSRKGVYPYDYMSSVEKFNETRLPNKENLYPQPNDCGILNEDYEHLQKVWKELLSQDIRSLDDRYL